MSTLDREIHEHVRAALLDSAPETFDGPDLSALRGAAINAGLRRRRRSIATVSVASVAAGAAVVTAIVAVSGPLAARPEQAPPAGASQLAPPAPASTSVTTQRAEARKDWSKLINSTGVFAYDIPELRDLDVPEGVREAKAAPLAGDRSDANLDGAIGSCFVDPQVSADRRLPVAGRTWAFTRGSTGTAAIAVVGFTTGTGAAAMDDYAQSRLDCRTWSEAKKPWAVPAGPAWTTQTTIAPLSDPSATRHLALAAIRVGDLIVTGTANDTSAEDARSVATGLAEAAADALRPMAFPPATGEPLGDSAEAPNAASKEGADAAEEFVPLGDGEPIGDIFPTTSQLPWGITYASDRGFEGPATPPATNPLRCNEPITGRAAPQPLGGRQNTAWPGAPGPEASPTIDIAATKWASGTGASVFADVTGGSFPGCSWPSKPQTQAWAGQDPDTAWLARFTAASGDDIYVAMRVVDDTIISVSATGADDASSQAIRLADLTAAKVARQ